MAGDNLRIACKRLVRVVLGPVREGVKVVARAKSAVAWVLVLRALVDERAVGVAENLLADDVDAVHSVVVRRIRDGKQGILMEFDDERSQLALSSSSASLSGICLVRD